MSDKSAVETTAKPTIKSSNKLSIKDWHEDDRPREKLLKFGAEHLTDAEILAIFLRTGTKNQSAIELARSLIDEFGSLAELLASPSKDVLACHGMGVAKYAQIMASLEMGKRYLASQLAVGDTLNRTQAVKDYVATQLRSETGEVFAVLCLDNGLKLIDYSVLFVGGIDRCAVCIKQTLRHALKHAASHLMVAQNHPSQPPEPSRVDRKLTSELFEACQLIDLHLIDHIIVGRNATLSFAEAGLSPFEV